MYRADIVELLATVTPVGLDFIGEGGVRRTEGMGAVGGGKGGGQLGEGGLRYWGRGGPRSPGDIHGPKGY